MSFVITFSTFSLARRIQLYHSIVREWVKCEILKSFSFCRLGENLNTLFYGSTWVQYDKFMRYLNEWGTGTGGNKFHVRSSGLCKKRSSVCIFPPYLCHEVRASPCLPISQYKTFCTQLSDLSFALPCSSHKIFNTSVASLPRKHDSSPPSSPQSPGNMWDIRNFTASAPSLSSWRGLGTPLHLKSKKESYCWR